MNHKTLLLNVAFALTILCTGCVQVSKSFSSDVVQATAANEDDLNGIPLVPLSENFEEARVKKTSYAEGVVPFSSGEWLLDDALTGGSEKDIKNGEYAVRIRKTGKLSMQFDITNIKTISIAHAAYGIDGESEWQLWASTNQGKAYQQIGETVTTKTQELTRVSFNVDFPNAVRFEIRKISGSTNRVNIDDIQFNSQDQPATAQVAEQKPKSSDTEEESKETEKSEVVKPQQSADSKDNSNILLGNPSSAGNSTANPENFLIDQKYYVISYSKTKVVPNWVSWHIGSSDLGDTKRVNDFRRDTGLPVEWYKADNTSYRDSGFDKGHNCPSGDRTSSTAANSSTFLMNNMIPQAPNNNQHTWEQLESYCRAQVKRGNEIYVIMGSYGSGGTGKNGFAKTIDNGRINVPARIWKVVLIMPEGNNDLKRINAETRVIAVDTPNDDSISPNWMTYLSTVRDIEKATGYNLFSALPKSLQDVIEIEKFKGGN